MVTRRTNVLFLCEDNSILGPMAEALLQSMAEPDRIQVSSCGVRAGEIHPNVAETLHELGIDIRDRVSQSISDMQGRNFDVIISLDPIAQAYCTDNHDDDANKVPLYQGVPLRLGWNYEKPALADHEQAVREQFQRLRDKLGRNLQTLLDLDVLSALGRHRERLERLLDVFGDGIIIHDQARNIFVYNRAAKEITGMATEDVLGANCHQVFAPDGLCGSQCPLHTQDLSEFEGQDYEVAIATQDGENRRLKVRSTRMDLDEGGPSVIVATLRDITEVSELRWKIKERYSYQGMVGVSASMQEVFNTIRQVITSSYPVMITGESGTGKELVARAIHNESRRRGRAFVPINCGALPENILESELFGHVRGAFTGAIRDKKGRFELADGGTLFLDEVGELSKAFQIKLLRVLEEQSFEMVGGERTIRVDVRVVSATNRDVRQMVKEGLFREDLFYRLCVVPIQIPPLRVRKEDLGHLVDHMLARIRSEIEKEIQSVVPDAMDLLMSYHWPGNIRELLNVLQFASVRCQGNDIQPTDLPPELREVKVSKTGDKQNSTENRNKKRQHLNVESVQQALAECGGNKVRAAKLLGVGRATLYRFLERHPLE